MNTVGHSLQIVVCAQLTVGLSQDGSGRIEAPLRRGTIRVMSAEVSFACSFTPPVVAVQPSKQARTLKGPVITASPGNIRSVETETAPETPTKGHSRTAPGPTLPCGSAGQGTANAAQETG